MSIRNSICEKWNNELIWGLSGRAVNDLQSFCMARIDPENLGNMWAAQERLNPTIEIANSFYTDNGVPINEDKVWDYSGRYSSQVAGSEDRFNLAEGYETAKLNYHRENRYYASLAFDGSVWYMQKNGSDEKAFTVKARMGQPQAKLGAYNYSVTGYWPKKLISWKFVLSNNSSTTEWFPWPELRLADLYLLYAEALNERDQTTAALDWIDPVRKRAGLKGVEESWKNYSTKPDKYKTKAGLREIIQQERTIELVFEGQRYYDVRRWKTAATELNQKIHGWDIDQEAPEAYYRPKVLFDQQFVAPRDYFSPLREEILYFNKNLVQNPNW
ncbi:RagB/SusD family nutrient uptake outer membrane protein [Prevotella sp. 10(H)]|uniref:RagB/SusD family nutrient uptake outer membrane protein n=1 Tax=Prevotella sp. 10(H) TaxID=1158294 RepID=UPI000A82EB44|nr:RagB/SusD family nutrient uptake outer membrane protein [Prevotella sp. 10(H)]